MASKHRCRLPTNVTPLKYSLRYNDLNLDSCTFLGSVAIDCQVNSVTRSVKMHALEIWVTVATVTPAGDVKPRRIETDRAEETVTFQFPQDLPVGSAQLKLYFHGDISD
ncbi:unnamed protein product [Choristocarpus tenellus]